MLETTQVKHEFTFCLLTQKKKTKRKYVYTLFNKLVKTDQLQLVLYDRTKLSAWHRTVVA